MRFYYHLKDSFKTLIKNIKKTFDFGKFEIIFFFLPMNFMIFKVFYLVSIHKILYLS